MPRAGLSAERVVTEAARIADQVGYDRLTLAAVAERFGVAVPSLYKHVDGLGALRRRVALLALRELGQRLATGARQAEGNRLLTMAEAYRLYARSHPGRYAATLRAIDPADDEAAAASREVLDTVLSVLSAYGIAGVDAVDATRALRSALHGFVALESAGGFGLPHDVDQSFVRLVEMFDGGFRTWNQGQPGHP